MIYTKQEGFDTFKCIAKKCPSSCCLVWQIMIDDDSLAKYANMALDGSGFGARMANSVDFEEGSFYQCNGRCSMLGEDGLCDLQLEKGEDALCDTCRLYPRHMEEFEDVREYSLSLSCPECARMLLEMEEFLDFSESETDEQDDIDEYEDFDFLMYSQLVEIREVIFEILKDKNLSIFTKIERIIKLSKQYQSAVDKGEFFQVEEAVEEIKGINDSPWDYELAKNDFAVLYQLEHLTDGWKQVLDDTWNKVLDSPEHFKKAASEMERSNVQASNILIQLIFTYFCGAVYDDMVYSKTMLAVSITRFSYLIAQSFEGDLCKALYSVAREIEHSDPNLNALEDWAMNKK